MVALSAGVSLGGKTKLMRTRLKAKFYMFIRTCVGLPGMVISSIMKAKPRELLMEIWNLELQVKVVEPAWSGVV